MKKTLFLIAVSTLICMACNDDSASKNWDEQVPCEGDNCDKPDNPQPVPCEGYACNNPLPEPCEDDECDNSQPVPCEGEECEESGCKGDECDDNCDDGSCSEVVKPCETEECQNEGDNCMVCIAGEYKCDDDNLMVCREIAGSENHCTEWQITEECKDGSRCSAMTKACVACKDVCSDNDKKCLDNGIATCKSDEAGCAVWTVVTPCSIAQHCDDESMSCVAGCKDQCEEGKTRCYQDNQIQTCVKSETGCLDWSTTETCEFAKFCTDERVSCDYACGDDCKPFSIVIIPDSQYYILNEKDTKLRETGGIFGEQLDWIIRNKETYNIKFVMHMGDAANDNKTYQYESLTNAYKTLGTEGIPFSIATGNHEYKKGDSSQSYAARSRSLFYKHFNDEYIYSIFKGKDTSWFRGFHYRDSMYATFEIGELKFAVIALEYAPRKTVLCWADDLIRNELKDRYVILTTHAYLYSDSHAESNKDVPKKDSDYSYFSGGTVTRGLHPEPGKNPYGQYADYGSSGSDMYRELFARHSNVIMVASGHYCEIARRDRPGYAGNNIHETVVDYQCEKPCLDNSKITECCKDSAVSGTGNGWLRLITIDPVNAKNSNGEMIPNATAQTFSAVDKYQKKGTFYCSNKYNQSVSEGEHKYKFTFDFTKPIHYEYSIDGNMSFGNRVINTISSGNQNTPAVAVHKETGKFVAVWEDDYSKDGKRYHDISARFFCAGGCDDQEQFKVSTHTTGTQRNPDVDMDRNGNIVVVWEDDYEDDGTYQIHMRGFDSNGKETIKLTTVNSEAKGQQFKPAVAVAPDGHFVVAWEDYSVNTANPQIYIRGFNADGTELFHDKNTMDKVAGTRKDPDIAMAPDGSFVVTWVDDTDGNGVTQIYAKAFNADGSQRLAHFTVNKIDDGNQLAPSVDINSKGEFFIVFDDQQSSKKHYITVCGFDSEGNKIFEDTDVSSGYTLDKTPTPKICIDDERRAAVTWKAMGKAVDDLEYGDILRREIGKTGSLSKTTRVNHNQPGIQESPSIACSSNGHYVILFTDDSDENGYTELFGSGGTLGK